MRDSGLRRGVEPAAGGADAMYSSAPVDARRSVETSGACSAGTGTVSAAGGIPSRPSSLWTGESGGGCDPMGSRSRVPVAPVAYGECPGDCSGSLG